MAQFEGGQYKVQLKSPDGKTTETVALEDLTNIQKEQFRASMDMAKDVDGMDEKDIAYKSMTFLEMIAGAEISSEVALKTGLSKDLQKLSDNAIEMTRDSSIVLSSVMKSIGGSLSIFASTLITGEDDMNKVMGDFSAVWAKTTTLIEESELGKWFQEATAPGDGGVNTTINNPNVNTSFEEVDDHFYSGRATVIPANPAHKSFVTSEIDNMYVTPGDLGKGDLFSDVIGGGGGTNKQEVTVKVDVSGTLDAFGIKPSDIVNDLQLMYRLKNELDVTEIAGKAAGGLLANPRTQLV